jgi:hypothetical protein
MLVEFIKGSQLGQTPAIEIEIEARTDSTTAVSWAKRGSLDCSVDYKSVEYRQILKLAEALQSEVAAPCPLTTSEETNTKMQTDFLDFSIDRSAGTPSEPFFGKRK